MANPLLDVPGLGGYLAQRELNQQEPVREMQQVAGVLSLAGALRQDQAARQAGSRKDAFRQEIAALGPNATQEQLASVAARYADDPEKLMDVQQKSLDRQSAATDRALQFAQNLEVKQVQLNLQREMFHQRTEDAAAKMAFDEWYKGETLKNRQEANALNAQLRTLGLEVTRQGQQLKLAQLNQQQGQQRDRQVAALGTALERANLPEADAVLRGVEDALKKTPDLAGYLSGPKSLLPDIAVGADIAAGRQAFQKLFNITLKNRSGAAVTVPEFDRLKQEFATGVWKTPEQLRTGIEQARKIVRDHYKSVAAGYGPATLRSYNENLRESGGMPILDGGGESDPLGIR